MQINTSYQPTHYSQSNIQAQYLRDSDTADRVKIDEDKSQQKNVIPYPLGELPRQTYGLSILEEMSDDEYRAFLRATAGMGESEKIFAAQSLYRLNLTYQEQLGKVGKNPYQPQEQDFLQAFQNALSFVKQG